MLKKAAVAAIRTRRAGFKGMLALLIISTWFDQPLFYAGWLSQSQRVIYQALTTALSIGTFRSSINKIQHTDHDPFWSHLCQTHSQDLQQSHMLIPDEIPALY